MKIAFCNRPSWNNPLGGDGVQMIKTKEALQSLYGIDIDIITDADDITREYDLVHIFNFITIKETQAFFEKAIRYNIPIAASSIFWDYTYACTRFMPLFIGKHFSGCRPKVYKLAVHLMVFFFGYPALFSEKMRKKYRFFCENSNIILPNSLEEGLLLQKFIKRPDIKDKMHIVYNGVDKKMNSHFVSKKDFLNKYGIPERYILEVARIEPVKNQINLLYALKDYPNIPVVFVGRAYDKSYYNKLKQMADKRGNVYFIDAVPHEEIDNFYRYAQLHVLLSLRESPGLVSLEALANNCPIVVANSKYAPVNTYFSDQPYVADPLDMKDIQSVILKAYKEGKVIKDNQDLFTWEMAAKQTYEGYCKILHKV